VEIELQLINPSTFDLIGRSEELLAVCKDHKLEKIKAEIHQSMIEVNTAICQNVKECRLCLDESFKNLQTLCRSLNISLASTGTHPFQLWKDRKIFPDQRYLYLKEKFQWLAQRMNVYGMHVHIGVSSGDRALALSNILIKYLPHFLALSSSSPFWQSIDTGLHSCRVGIMESFPYAGLPRCFSNWQEFEYYYDTLVQAGAISSLKDLYWFIRPNPTFGTLEIRIFDALPTLEETLAVVSFVHCLTVWLDQFLEDHSSFLAGFSNRPIFWITPANIWTAARDGLDAVISIDEKGTKRRLREDIAKLVEDLAPVAKSLNCEEELQGIHKILIYGTSSQRQRKLFSKTRQFQDIVNMAIKEFAANRSTD